MNNEIKIKKDFDIHRAEDIENYINSMFPKDSKCHNASISFRGSAKYIHASFVNGIYEGKLAFDSIMSDDSASWENGIFKDGIFGFSYWGNGILLNGNMENEYSYCRIENGIILNLKSAIELHIVNPIILSIESQSNIFQVKKSIIYNMNCNIIQVYRVDVDLIMAEL